MQQQHTLPHEIRRKITFDSPYYITHTYTSAAAIVRAHLGVGRLSPAQAAEVRALVARKQRLVATTLTLHQRLTARLTVLYVNEIRRRGGETEIRTDKNSSTQLRIEDRRNGFTLMRVEGWRYYSRRFGSRPTAIAYLCGRDDSGLWATRVPGTITSVQDALDWITPADVHKARGAGRQVLRQGDVYAIESRADNIRQLPGSHHWDTETRTLTHEEHAPLHVPFPARFVQQRELHTRRGGAGD